MREWLKEHPHDRKSAKGKARLSNRTDNESAKMPTDKGVVQGYTGVAAVDEKHQIIVEAQAHGTGSEQELLLPMTEAIEPVAKEHTVVCADSGYHSEDNLKQLEAQGHRGVHPRQPLPRARSALRKAKSSTPPSPMRCGTRARSRPPSPNCSSRATSKWPPDHSHCICPAGKRLYRNGTNCNIGGRQAIKFTGAQRDCENCPLRAQCLRHPQRTPVRQVAIFVGKHAKAQEKASERMKRKIDTDQGPGDDRPALCHRGAGVRQPPIQQGAQPLHLARPTEGRRAVEALLPGAQHREAGQQRIREVGSEGQDERDRQRHSGQAQAISGHPLVISAARHTKRGGLMMAILGCRKQVLRQPR